jgi:hypothetical protein
MIGLGAANRQPVKDFRSTAAARGPRCGSGRRPHALTSVVAALAIAVLLLVALTSSSICRLLQLAAVDRFHHWFV